MKTFELEKILRKNILELQPYASARDEFQGLEGIFLDANENPFGKLNRYPDPYQTELKNEISALKQIDVDNIFVGNGSDEIIDLVFRIFCEPSKDKALTFSPTYGMYEVVAAINNVDLIQVPLTDNFQIDRSNLTEYLSQDELKLILICSPNNPTGNSINAASIQEILEQFSGIILIDEAYIDFSPKDSWSKMLAKYPNLIVCQTMSKAWGLAGARVGFAFASQDIVKVLNKVKAPYNLSSLNQAAAIQQLQDQASFEAHKQMILKEKLLLEKELEQMPFVKKVYPSDANFLLIEVEHATALYERLVAQNIIVRNRDKMIANCLRITVGSPAENQALLQTLKKEKNYNEKSIIY